MQSKKNDPHQLARGLGWFSILIGATEVFGASALQRMMGVRSTGMIRLMGLRELISGLIILSQNRPSSSSVWFRVRGDVMDMIALSRLLQSRTTNRPGVLAAVTAVASATAADVFCARQLSQRERKPVTIRRSVTVTGSPEDLHTLWLDHLPEIMAHMADVQVIDSTDSKWTIELPVGASVEWRARIVENIPGELIRWESIECSDIRTEGFVRFAADPSGRGSVVTVDQTFELPGGGATNIAAHTFSGVPNALTTVALRRFKSLAESGQIPTLDENPTARSGATANLY